MDINDNYKPQDNETSKNIDFEMEIALLREEKNDKALADVKSAIPQKPAKNSKDKSALNEALNSTCSVLETLLRNKETSKGDEMDVYDPKSSVKTTSSSDNSGEVSPGSINGKKSTFVDSLLDKIRCKNSDSSGSEMSKLQQLLSDSEEDLLVEVEAPVRYIKSANPNLLATPLVRNQRLASVFGNTEEEYEKVVARHKSNTTVSSESRNDSLQSEAPRMQAPPANLQRPRTLAEKRLMVNNNVKFLIVEQESKIYRQVQRKKDRLEVNYGLLDSMMRHDVPINHGPFKVLTWLRTRDGNHTIQYLILNGKKYKLNGSRGNHSVNYVKAESSDPLPKNQTTSLRSTRCCKGGRVSKSEVKLLCNLESIKKFVLNESADPFKRLDTKFLENRLLSIKPRPLSKKIKFINENRKLLQNDEDEAFLGDYAKFQMPETKLQVNISPKTSLNPLVKKYLNEIIPYKDLDENWCEFALSALTNKVDSSEKKQSFDFTIPYEDNKKEILVREIIRAKEDNERLRIFNGATDDDDDIEWTFSRNSDKNDPVECEIVDIIKDLTNSVFINLNDDLFTQEDSHNRKTSSRTSPLKLKEAIDELSPIVKPNTSKKVLTELKKLNANFYKPESSSIENEIDIRRNATAHLGKIERELRPTVIVTESDTMLLSERETRRVKRVPKKFDDYENSMSQTLHSDSDDEEPAAKKMKMPSETGGDLSFKGRRPSSPEYEGLMKVKKEVYKMLHVSVDVRRMEEVTNLEVWCMVHKLYKCFCKGHLPVERPSLDVLTKKKVETFKPLPAAKPAQTVPNHESSRETSLKKPPQVTPQPEPDEPLVDDGYSRRVLPVILNGHKQKPRLSAVLNGSADNLRKIEIVNLCDLINGGIGPIFINVYDDKSLRLNPILRSVLNNKNAIIYFDGAGYFIDKSRVDVKKLDFSSVSQELDHPIFIIQAKENCPPPVSSLMDSDFVKILFKKDCEEVIHIRDKIALKELEEIIESILRNVKKKIQSKIEGEPSDLVKEQLLKITRDRTSSVSNSESNSSTHSSPLSFEGRKLKEAPPPGMNTSLMQQFNKIFSSRMQTLVGMISSNTLGLSPSNEMLNKFYLYQWSLLLKSFDEGLIQIWQVRLESESNEGYQMLALTDSREVPEIEHANKENIINIRKLNISDDTTELTRLILLRVENAAMKNMTILLYGCKDYFRICGILKSKEDYVKGFVARPTRETHPRIAAKIQKIYHIWYASRKQQSEKAVETIKESERIVRAEPRLAEIGDKKKTTPADFKWFLFNITNDFTDIYIKSWSRYLSFKVIQEVINRAKTLNRAVALTTTTRYSKTWPRIYALPGPPLKFKDSETMTDNFLIFGPYLRNSNSNLLLMQNVDGELMLRDDYERRNNIKRLKRTRCLWIYANTLQCLQDADPHPVKLMFQRDYDDAMKRKKEDEEKNKLTISTVIGGFIAEEINGED